MEGRDAVIYKLSRLLVPVCELDDDGRQAIASSAQVVRLAAASRLEASEDESWLTYLVKGELAIHSTDGVIEVVPSGSGRARRPLFNAHPPGIHAQARATSVLLRFDRGLFRSLLTEQQRPRAGVHALSSQQLFSRIYGAWFEETLTLPPLARELHLLYGAGGPESLRDFAAVLRRSPPLAERFVAAVNRLPGQTPARHAGEAAMQLGLAGARLLAPTLAVRPLFQCESPAARRLAERQFNHALLIGVLGYMIARRRGVLDPYRALVAGLVHDLAAMLVPAWLDRHPETSASDEACTIAMRRLAAVVGPALLTRLGFDPSLAQAAEQAEHWHRNEPRAGDADLLIVAHLFAAQEDPAPPVPPWHRVPALERVCPQTSRTEAIEILRKGFRLCASIRRRAE